MFRRKKNKKIRMSVITDVEGLIVGIEVPDKTTVVLNKIAEKYGITGDQILKEFLDSNFNMEILAKYGIDIE